jgi:hypothetical protein
MSRKSPALTALPLAGSDPPADAGGAGDSPASRRPIIRYLGFRSTPCGREYTLRVADVASCRDFVLFISHEAFAARETRFQDAPDVCSEKLRRELAADPDLLPGEGITLTSGDLRDYRHNQHLPLDKRVRHKP